MISRSIKNAANPNKTGSDQQRNEPYPRIVRPDPKRRRDKQSWCEKPLEGVRQFASVRQVYAASSNFRTLHT
jgi:hypothetical protein